MTFTHATIDGTRFGIDADGRVFAPDADGTPDALVIGRVARAVNPRWFDGFDNHGAFMTDAPTRTQVIRDLHALFHAGVIR